MHKTLATVAFSWLIFSGVAHFLIDVVSHHVRGKRTPGVETTLYYGLHSSYALSQLLLGIIGVLLARRALEILSSGPMVAVGAFAIAAWFAIGFAFIEYREPKIMVGIFTALFAAAVVMR